MGRPDDLISRAEAIEQIKHMPYWFTPDGYCALTYDDIKAAINNAPTIDAVPVVRCKDCKHGKHIFDSFGRPYVECYNPFIQNIWYRNLTDYCSDGKKEEDGGKNDE